jgi:hypothetical protein
LPQIFALGRSDDPHIPVLVRFGVVWEMQLVSGLIGPPLKGVQMSIGFGLARENRVVSHGISLVDVAGQAALCIDKYDKPDILPVHVALVIQAIFARFLGLG